MDPFDCELLRQGWPAQPVNTVSALVFIGAAIWLWQRGQRLGAGALAGAGIGSLWLHGSPGAAASWAHDVGLYTLIAVAAVTVWRLLAASRPPILAGSVFAVGLVVWFFSRTGGALCDPGSALQGHALWHLLAGAAAVAIFSADLEEPRAKAG